MRQCLLILVCVVLPTACGPGAKLHVDDDCSDACCQCETHEDCNPPNQCWPFIFNDQHFMVCSNPSERCMVTGLGLSETTKIMRLSFLPSFRSEVLDFSRGTSCVAEPAPAEGDIRLTADGSLYGGFARAWTDGESRSASVVAVGPVAFLEEIREAPYDGYEEAVPVVLGHGYVVRCEEHTYARCRVRQPLVKPDGTLIGWMLEWSYQADGSRLFTP